MSEIQTRETPEQARLRARELARDVLLEAFGASTTPFVPLPFVDDWMLARLLRRIAGKVLARHGLTAPADLPRIIVEGYVAAGSASMVKSVVLGAARFVVRKVAVVLDVKKSYDVFGQSIAFALALDIAAANGWVHEASAERVGASIHHTLAIVGSGALEALTRAGREAFAQTAGGGPPVPNPSRVGQLSEAIGGEVEHAREQLEPVLQHQMFARRPAT